MKPRIQYIKHPQLDLNAWRSCVETSAGPAIYGDPDFLRAMAGDFDALVVDDYAALMPIFKRTKWGIEYLYQPAFIQKTGIFHKPGASGSGASGELCDGLISYCKNKFSFGEICINGSPGSGHIKERANYILPLDKAYAFIRSSYSGDLLKNLKIAARYDFEYRKSTEYTGIVRIFRDAYAERLSYNGDDYSNFAGFCGSKSGTPLILARELHLDGQLYAACLCLRDHQRLYLIMNYTSAAGRKMAANHLLVDRLISEFAGKIGWLDFEGSDQPGIAHFYKNYGAVNEPYYFVAWNRLPWPLRLLKPAYQAQ
jgi:hypothetical protein